MPEQLLDEESVDTGTTDVYALTVPEAVSSLIQDSGARGQPVVFAESDIEGTSYVRIGERIPTGLFCAGLFT